MKLLIDIIIVMKAVSIDIVGFVCAVIVPCCSDTDLEVSEKVCQERAPPCGLDLHLECGFLDPELKLLGAILALHA